MENTPNPKARKFIIAENFFTDGRSVDINIQKYDRADVKGHSLSTLLLKISHIERLFYNKNVLTITIDDEYFWKDIEPLAVKMIRAKLSISDKDWVIGEDDKNRRDRLTPVLRELELLMDEKVRPYLASDGGDLKLIKLEQGILFIRYEGACSGCPSSMGGTLNYLQQVVSEFLQENIRIKVVV